MANGEQSKKRKGGLVIGIVMGIVIAALAGVIVYLLITRNTQPGPEKRNVVVTNDNAEQVYEEINRMEESAAVTPGYYTVTMNTTWHFKSSSEASYDAVVENVENNTNDVYFDIVSEGDETQVLYKSPVIPRGEKLTNIALDEQLEAGTYPCVVIYHLVDENQNTLSTLRVTLSIIIEE